MILYHFSKTSRYFKQDKISCVNKNLIEVSPKITEVYKMPRSKRIFDVFVASSVLFYLHLLLTTYYTLIRLESKGKYVLYIKRVGRKTLTFTI
jgi:lipopolysaccharide/colanic/teichoic acid biosynthesis glycosyltransferase